MSETEYQNSDLNQEQEAIDIRRSQTDPEAFKPLYEKYFKKIFLFTLRRVNEKEIARDITQQVFLKALNSIRKFQLRGLPFSAWLFRIAVNECNDYFRKTKKARLITIDEQVTESLFEEMMADNRLDELNAKLPAILKTLSPVELQLIEFRFFEQRSFREIGLLLDLTETYAKVKTYRALDKMKNRFLNDKI
ncbi:MAG: sigma-70 family RNA polymerase sigma factor [Cyclobacteriaceae bacterium]|nr:sigma-70 family RNA polymerase sigma factor [Cyclobacteriaceae bacterium]